MTPRGAPEEADRGDLCDYCNEPLTRDFAREIRMCEDCEENSADPWDDDDVEPDYTSDPDDPTHPGWEP